MCNHAVSLAQEDFRVTLVGYGGSNLKAEVNNNDNIAVARLPPFPVWLANCLPRLITLFLKALWQLLTLYFILPFTLPHHGPDFILMQNPPTIPTLIVAYIYACFHWKTKLVLDWHNYGYSIMELSFGSSSHPLVRLARWIEGFFGPRVHSAFCVSKAMKRDLHNKWKVEATVLYDRPGDSFRPCSVEERHDLFFKLAEVYPEVLGGTGLISTRFTELNTDGFVRLKVPRPGLLVSSTSWTPDEDFGILFEALSLYEERCEASASKSLPDLVVVITGKGPLKEYYSNLIAEQCWQHVSVVMPWLEPEDYPRMLASADLGVCLHTSSSGVDLPMKVCLHLMGFHDSILLNIIF